jgi:hypothetical protein
MGDNQNESCNEFYLYSDNENYNSFYFGDGSDIFYDNDKNLSQKDSSTKNEIVPINYETSNQTKTLFKTLISHKRKNSDKIKHPWNATDNISDRVLTHYDNSLIDLANDATNTIFNSLNQKYFLKIKYSEHKKNYNNNLISEKKYCDIFKYQLSAKNKGYKIKNGDTNENRYNIICAKSPLLKKFFEQRYLDLFENYYYNDKRNFDFDGKHFQLSDDTKTFSDLLNKGNGKNRSAENIFINVINNNYLNINKK